MKSFFTFGVLSLLFISCIDLGFDNTQPEGEAEIQEFPASLLGTFANKEDTLIIRPDAIISGNDSTTITFSDTLKVKEYEGWYFINFTESDQDYWTVVCARRKGNKLQVRIPELKEEDKDKLEKKWAVREQYSNLGNLKAYVISPDKKEWKKLLKSRFYTKSVFTKID